MNQGVSQNGRFQKALEGNYFSVDERSMLDLLQFTIQYAEKVRYFDFNNQTSNTWNPFIMNDPLFVIAKIAGTDLNNFKTKHDPLLYKLNESNGIQKTNLKRQVATNILELAKHFKIWEDWLLHSNFSGPLLQEIQNSLNYLSDRLHKIIKKQENITPEDLGIISKPSQEVDQDIVFDEAFKSVYKSLLFIQKLAVDRFKAELFEKKKHLPHIGLLIAFRIGMKRVFGAK